LPSQPLNEILIWHRALIHIIPATILFFYVTLTHSPLKHLFLSPLNIFFRSLRPKSVLAPLPDIEEAETFGVREIFEFTWKQLLDLEACTACGRCQEVCPAFLSGKPLSPKKITQNLKEDLWSHAPMMLSKSINNKREKEPIVGSTITEDELWACTACMACEEVCPVYIEQIPRNIDLRRYLVLMETRYPSGLRGVYK
ncbi:MAG: 4Fe-4S dicluster domain-containing protein, partial [Thermodesulfobacteriota bacterium]